MKIVVLGSAAGGGLPQWNCNCSNCRRCRAGDPAISPRTQASIAVSASEGQWFVINAAPDLRQQIGALPQLHPQGEALRHSAISGVVLTGSEIDQITGLLTLRESHPLALYATAEVQAILAANPVFEALKRDHVARRPLALGEAIDLQDRALADVGLRIELFSVPGKIPLYLEGDLDPAAMQGAAGDTVGVEIAANGKRTIYIPGCARLTPELLKRIDGADLLLFDGTLWDDDEMIRQGLSEKTGRRMGHISVSGPDGTIAGLAATTVGRKVFIHINNSNPLLDDGSEARREAKAAGWDVAFDGQEFSI
jgi:pyrroloquinoline quinone biosynthesis protein B